MKKETIDKANELEAKIRSYNKIASICRFPYIRFRLFKKKAYICKSDETTIISINDEELAKLIENYCREKIKALQQEIEEL